MPNQSLQLYPLRILTVYIGFTVAAAYGQLLLWPPSMSKFTAQRPTAVPSVMHIHRVRKRLYPFFIFYFYFFLVLCHYCFEKFSCTSRQKTEITRFIHAYLLTPWSRVLLEKLTGSAASQEINRIFGTRKFITVLTSARHLSLS